MSLPLSPGEIAAKEKLTQEQPWIWLYEIEIPTDPPTRLRLARNTENVVFGTSNLGAPLTYYRFPIGHQSVKRDSEGGLSTTTLIVSNVTREVQALLEEYEGLIGQNVRIMLVNAQLAVTGVPTLKDDFQILSVSTTEQGVSAQLGQQNLYEASFPSVRYLRDHCRHQYKGALCKYVGVIATCSKTLDGKNGCSDHSNEPNFGGFPGIPKLSGSLG